MFNININKLRSEVEEREQRKIKIYEKVLNLCYQKILNTNKQYDDYTCTYIVPNVVFGLPLYNFDECVQFIMNKLIEKGFQFKYHTHIYNTKTEKTYFYCYEYGYLPLENNWYLIVKKNEE